MRTALLSFLIATLLPLFFGSTRFALFALALQGLALTLILGATPESGDAAWLVHLADLGLVRAVIVPLLLSRYARRGGTEPLIPPNLLHWTTVGLAPILGFWFAARVAHVDTFAAGTGATGVLVGLLVLVHQDSRMGQVIAAVFIENSIAIFELSGPERAPWPVAAGLAIAFAASMLVFATLLRLESRPAAPVGEEIRL
ncbi:MAG TPA: hypothetical protein VMV18_13230 [bacterium]|nr:hypothetical protein [bacterium]